MLIIEPLVGMVSCGRGLLQRRIGRDHLARDKILADAEMLQRSLGLRSPKFVGRHSHNAKAVGLFSQVGHLRFSIPWLVYLYMALDFTSYPLGSGRGAERAYADLCTSIEVAIRSRSRA